MLMETVLSTLQAPCYRQLLKGFAMFLPTDIQTDFFFRIRYAWGNGCALAVEIQGSLVHYCNTTNNNTILKT